MKNKEQVSELLQELNKFLKKEGLLEIALVNPKECIAQKVNARYFTVEKFEQLVSNVKRTGALESVPLVYVNDELRSQQRYEIVSGHHRVEAAVAAGLPTILVMVVSDITRDELVSKQLSHNALVGQDDKQVLMELFNSIKDIELKMASGLNDELDKITYESLNFKVGSFKTFVVGFIPSNLENYELVAEQMEKSTALSLDDTMVVASLDDYDKFVEAMQKIKKIENIKSNAVAFHRIVELSHAKLMQLEVEWKKNAKQAKEAKAQTQKAK